jgi:hypothetical protein
MKILLLLMLCAVSVSACDRGWEYFGTLPTDVLCIVQTPIDSSLIVGTFAGENLAYGGVFRKPLNGSEWQYAGLRGSRVNSVLSIPYCRSSVFAVTNSGLYYFLNDTSWVRVTRVGTTLGEQRSFAISPFDTSIWVISNYYAGEGHIYLSNNSGQNWRYFYVGGVSGNLLFSRVHQNILYFTEDNMLRSINTIDSTVETVIAPPHGIGSLVFHPHESFLYGRPSDGIIRFDEQTGDTIFSPTPFVTAYLGELEYVVNDGLYVSSANGIYKVSDDLSAWTPIYEADQTRGWQFIYSSQNICVAANADTIFRVNRAAGISLPHNAIDRLRDISVCPNPNNGLFNMNVFKGKTVELYDILGRCLVKTECRNTIVPFDLSRYPLGNYFYFIYDSKLTRPIQSGRVTVIR